MEKFTTLGLAEPLLNAIRDLGFTEPSEIQAKTIPLVIEGKDVIAGAATGSGKTLAFGSGIIQNGTPGEGLQALILTPTRELAEQIAKAMGQYAKYKPFHIEAIYGGVSINPQIDALPHADIVVGTPGRILDHMERRTIDLSKVRFLVLDEADRMLDMGFLEDVERILKACPTPRQTMLFSATIYQEIADLAGAYMHEPQQISVEMQVDPRKLAQVYYDVSPKAKFSLLVYLLKHEESGLVMVFCNSRHNVDFVATNLELNGISALAIHGGFTQAKRTKVLEHFHGGKVGVLVCTDVAGRGLDIPGVSHVYNYDVPADSKDYIHRIGRTARAGQEGRVINILQDRDHDNFSRVLWDTQANIERLETPDTPRVNIKVIPRDDGGNSRPGYGRPGGRPMHGRPPRRGPPRHGPRRHHS